MIWGLVAVFVAERDDRREAAWFALAGAFLVAAALVWRPVRRSADVAVSNNQRTGARADGARQL